MLKSYTGYNFPSLLSILPYLEPTAAGHSTIWAKATAARYNCIVTVGYPELYTPSLVSPTASIDTTIAYNSTVTVSPTGKILAHYRKTHLYYTDETWAHESPERWLSTPLAFTPKTQPEQSVQASFGICMDLNPHKFTAPWEAYEFASHALASKSEILVLSMAWLTNLSAANLALEPEQPDLATLSYWIERLKPLVEGEEEVIAVFANRSGEEPGMNPMGVEEGVRYAGSSWIGRVGKGQVRIWGMLGRAEEKLCFVDTEERPQWVLRIQPKDEEAAR